VKELGGQIETTEPHGDHQANNRWIHDAAVPGRMPGYEAIPEVDEDVRGQDEDEHGEDHRVGTWQSATRLTAKLVTLQSHSRLNGQFIIGKLLAKKPQGSYLRIDPFGNKKKYFIRTPEKLIF